MNNGKNNNADISEVMDKNNHKSFINDDFSKILNNEKKEFNAENKPSKFSIRNFKLEKLTNFIMIQGFITKMICKKKNHSVSEYEKLRVLNSKLFSFLDCTSLIARLVDVDYYVSSKKLELTKKENNLDNIIF